MSYIPEKTIYLCLAHMSEDGIEQKYVKEAFDTNWVVPLGPNVNAFEEDLKNFVGGKNEVVALSAGTAAVHLALIGCGVQAGDEVLVQSFTFCASSHPVTNQRPYGENGKEAQGDCSGGALRYAIRL